MKVTHYKQCKLRQTFKKDGKVIKTVETVSWIPEQFAVVGDILKLKNAEGKWVDGWEVISDSDPIPASVAEANSRLYRAHREATDVVLSDLRKKEDDGSYRKNRD